MDIIGNLKGENVLNEVYSPLTGSIIAGAETNRLAFEGKVWTCRHVITVPAGISNLFIDPTATVGQNKAVSLTPPFFSAVGGEEIILTLYGGSTYTGGTGTVQVIGNRNQNVPGLPLTVINYGATLVTPGVAVAEQLVGSSASFFSTSAGMSTANGILVANSNIVSRYEINNTDTASQRFEFDITFVEFDI